MENTFFSHYYHCCVVIVYWKDESESTMFDNKFLLLFVILRNLPKISLRTSSHHSTNLTQYLNPWVEKNDLLSPFYMIIYTAMRHSLCSHAEWWGCQSCRWQESGSNGSGWIKRCPSGGMCSCQIFLEDRTFLLSITQNHFGFRYMHPGVGIVRH